MKLYIICLRIQRVNLHARASIILCQVCYLSLSDYQAVCNAPCKCGPILQPVSLTEFLHNGWSRYQHDKFHAIKSAMHSPENSLKSQIWPLSVSQTWFPQILRIKTKDFSGPFQDQISRYKHIYGKCLPVNADLPHIYRQFSNIRRVL